MACPICRSLTGECSFLHSRRIEDEGPMALWKAPDRIYLNSKGDVCDRKDPDSATLLVAKGGTIPHAVAVRYGLAEAIVPKEEPTERKPGSVKLGRLKTWEK